MILHFQGGRSNDPDNFFASPVLPFLAGPTFRRLPVHISSLTQIFVQVVSAPSELD